jgi:hypothetical protein
MRQAHPMAAWRFAPPAFFLIALPWVAGAGSPLGDCSAESGLAGRVFCEPWESPHWWQNGYVNHPRLENPVPATEEEHRPDVYRERRSPRP